MSSHFKGKYMSVNQKQAVTNAVLSVYPDYELGGEVTLSSIITKENKSVIKAILAEGFESGDITMTSQAQAKYVGNPTEMTKYVGGLLDNWIRKNPEFNAGSKYITKNPGSRAGSGDEQVRAMRSLKKTTNDPATLEAIDKEIASRLAEIKPVHVVTIDVDHLPESLKHLVK